jgi:hypothetical protein
MAGGGHWLTGTGIMITAYAVSLVSSNVSSRWSVQADDHELVRQYADVVHRHARCYMAPAPGTDRKTASAFPTLNRISIWRLPGPMRGNPVVKQWT